MRNTAPALQITNITKTFGHTVAVKNASLEIPHGQVVALLGKNGAGKTTLVDITLGLQQQDSGTAKLFNVSPRQAIRRSLVGVVHQTGALLGEYTVGQTLKLFAATHTNTLPMDQVLKETHLSGLVSRPVRKLSGGEQQRVRLALALLPDPLLLILDEPTAGMDATARQEFWALMTHQAERGRTIVFATHYLAEAQDHAPRTVIMKDGEVIADGPTDELRKTTSTRTLRSLVPQDAKDQVNRQLSMLPASADLTISWSDRDPGAEADSDTALLVRSSDTDSVARMLLNIRGVHGLEITGASLEDAFTQLTA